MKFKELLEELESIKFHTDRLAKFYSLNAEANRVLDIINGHWFRYLRELCEDRCLEQDDNHTADQFISEEDKANIHEYFIYRDIPIAVCIDDPGQQFYFLVLFNGKVRESGCGAFNPEYEDEVMDYIDQLYWYEDGEE